MLFPGQKCLYIIGKIANPLKILKTEGVDMCLNFRLYPMDKYTDQHHHKLLHNPHEQPTQEIMEVLTLILIIRFLGIHHKSLQKITQCEILLDPLGLMF